MKTVALFGGSFDPPHIGHIEIVRKLKQLSYIDKIVIMPTYLNPFKERFYAPAHIRLHWLRKIFADDIKIEVSDFEVLQKKKIPTYETVYKLLKEFDKVYIVIGADNVASLHKWYNYEQLKTMAEFIVFEREGYEIPKEFNRIELDIPLSSTKLRQKINKEELPQEVQEEIYSFYNTRRTMQTRVENITQILDKHKAENIEVFDLEGKDYIVDRAIIASSLGQKHTLALLDHLKKELKPDERFNYVDESGDWVVIDLGDILIHIMTPEYRTKYDLESFLSEIDKQKQEEF